jgi:hypothetical protein
VNLYIIVAVLVIATIIGAIGIRRLLRRLLSPAQAEQAEHTVPFLLGSIGGFFGLVGGLLLSSSWSDLQALRPPPSQLNTHSTPQGGSHRSGNRRAGPMRARSSFPGSC